MEMSAVLLKAVGSPALAGQAQKMCRVAGCLAGWRCGTR